MVKETGDRSDAGGKNSVLMALTAPLFRVPFHLFWAFQSDRKFGT